MRRPTWVRGLCWAIVASPYLLCGTVSSQPSPARRPEVWSIVVGVGNYIHPGLPDSRTAARNAGRVLQWIRRAGWDDQHQVLLSDFGRLDPGDPHAPAPNILPRKQNLDWAFRQWLFPKAQPGDLVVFYFDGQSRAVVKHQGPQLDPRVDHYLLPEDAAAENPEQTGWSLDQAVDECARGKLQVICWLATSVEEHRGVAIPPPPVADRRGAPAPFSSGPVPGRPRVASSAGVAWLARLARWPGVTAWLAAEGSRRPVPGADPANDFTQALLDALGTAEPQPEGKSRRKLKPNLAACLKDLQQRPMLKFQGFASVGGVPPSMTLWAGEIGKVTTPPKPELVLQVGHADKLTAMEFTADGRQIMTASMDSTVRVWSAPDRSLLRVLPGQTVGATALILTRDDRWLISGGGRGAVLVYDRQNDFAPRTLRAGQPHHVGIRQIALLPDGVHFVSVDRDGRSFLWDPTESPLSPRPWLPDVVCQEVASGGRSDRDGEDTGVVIARCGDGTVRAFDSAGGGGAVVKLPRDHPTALAVSPEGRMLAAGFSDGLVVVRDLKAQRQEEYRAWDQPAAVHRLAFSSAGRLAVGHDKGARLLSPARRPPVADSKVGAGAAAFDLIAQRPQDLAFSPGGDYLAACTQEVGAVRVWRIEANEPPAPVLDDAAAQAVSLGFTGNGRGLVVGDFDGGVAFRPLDPQGDEVPWTFPANRGRLQQLSATPSRALLLFLDEQRNARIWDLKDRTCRRLRGSWSAGVFLDDDRLVLIPDSNSADLAGRLVLIDRARFSANPAFFAREAGAFKVPDELPFERLVISPDGKQIAAASDAAKEPMVCVWETEKGRLTHWIRPARLEDAVLALSFSTDGRYLLSGGDSPAAQLWDLAGHHGNLDAPAVTFSDPTVGRNITCVAIRPGQAGPVVKVVTGHSDGQVHAWKWAGGKADLEMPGLVAREFATAVKAVCFTSDGRYLAAAGDGTRIWVGAMEPQPHSIDVLERLRPHHYEQINALTTWRDRPILISGSDDTTIRFWDLEGGTLWGTFSAASRPAISDAAPVQELDWALYTPAGLFDASAAATRLVHYRRPDAPQPPDRSAKPKTTGLFSIGFRRLDRPQQLDQFTATHNIFGLGEQLLRGEKPGLKPQPDEPSPVSISVPPRTDPTLPEARLTITLGAADLKEIRLYHNDVPIPTAWSEGSRRPNRDLSLDVTVRLVPNRNRFYVMASREGAYDSCSKVVEVDYEAPMEAGQFHILALGVGAYDRRRLKYAQHDAEHLSEVLNRRGLDAKGRRGLRLVLPNAEVSRENVESAFDEIARRVEDRPQDTVVVFLAGHTGVFDPQRFCLLLPTYPFSDQAPIQVAARDVALDSGEGAKVDSQFVLPYSLIELGLARLKALNRLVIVDACQAESILVDPKVRAIQKWMELSSRRARTSYLMAARRGEPALEVDPLKHGLFTYTLLRGMRAVPLDSERKEIRELGLPPDADFNKDGVLSTHELDAYAKQVLPQLAKLFPVIVDNTRSAVEPRNRTGAPPPNETLEQSARLQSTEASFSLVPVSEANGP